MAFTSFGGPEVLSVVDVALPEPSTVRSGSESRSGPRRRGFVSVVPPATPPTERGVRMEIVGPHSDGAQLRELVQFVERGHLTLRVADVLTFAHSSEAHARFAKDGLAG
ncbi:NADP-dependent oxidoreductase, partial [Plantactinospora sp. S1510]|nr:NADP-dependent oxidoreductase [Plantactinospora alkalitolerans]